MRLRAGEPSPVFLKKYFWDIDFNRLDRRKSKLFILKRILEYGDEKAAAWMLKNFRRADIARFLSFARIEPKSANFWSLVLGIKKEKVLCLGKRYLATRKKIWPY
jgi:hypothetical protein